MDNRAKLASVGVSMFLLGAFVTSHLSGAAHVAKAAGGTDKIYACKNLTTLLPRIVDDLGDCSILEEGVEWRQGPENGTEFPYICHGCNLNNVEMFAGRNLEGAWLNSTMLDSVSLAGTDFTGANLAGASFNESDFTGANLTNADLTDTDFEYATGMASSTRTGAIWSNTTCPDGTNSENNSGTCEGHLTF